MNKRRGSLHVTTCEHQHSEMRYDENETTDVKKAARTAFKSHFGVTLCSNCN
jgi:triosephosphate isomerase